MEIYESQKPTCHDCGNPLPPERCSKYRCSLCQFLYDVRCTKPDLIEIRKKLNHCTACGIPVNNPRMTRCRSCKKRRRVLSIEAHKKFREKIENAEIIKCFRATCLAPSLPGRRLCEVHFFFQYCRSNKIPKEFIPQLYQSFKSSPQRCALSGVPLTIGDSLSIDHIIPVSKDGTHTPDNLRFLDHRINIMLNNMTDDEFLQRCKAVVDYNSEI